MSNNGKFNTMKIKWGITVMIRLEDKIHCSPTATCEKTGQQSSMKFWEEWYELMG